MSNEITGDILANLLPVPERLAAVLHFMGFASYQPLAGALGLSPGEVVEVEFTSEQGYYKLLLNIRVVCSSPVVRFEVIKDSTPELSLDAFSEYDRVLPSCYTPLRRTGTLRFTNLSGISSPAISYIVEQLVVPVKTWDMIKGILRNSIQDGNLNLLMKETA